MSILLRSKMDESIVLDFLHPLNWCMDRKSFLYLCLSSGQHQVTNIKDLYLWTTREKRKRGKERGGKREREREREEKKKKKDVDLKIACTACFLESYTVSGCRYTNIQQPPMQDFYSSYTDMYRKTWQHLSATDKLHHTANPRLQGIDCPVNSWAFKCSKVHGTSYCCHRRTCQHLVQVSAAYSVQTLQIHACRVHPLVNSWTFS